MNNVAVELVQFKIARGVDEESFLKASDAVQSFLNRSRGFVHRELAKTPDGLHWIDIVKWRTREEADQASRIATKDPSCMKFFELIDRSSIKTQHMEITRSYY
ncbi:MAG TPA: hypothetical protein VLA68_06725 [Nitrososphaera sp.]|nr:hypothetical protein [Nitrososphaera sp.]